MPRRPPQLGASPTRWLQLKSAAAAAIEAALSREAGKRKTRTVEQWTAAEKRAVHDAANEFASQHGLAPVKAEDVAKAERLALGHTDYGRKWPPLVPR